MDKMYLQPLFRRSASYHRRMLRSTFRANYNPHLSDRFWTINLSEHVMSELRLHLSWELGISTFTWTREEVGTRLLRRFKKSGILLFLIHVIKKEMNH